MDLEQVKQNDPEYADKFSELFNSTGELIKDHLRAGPPNSDKVYRVLNVLAAHAATVIAGTDREAYEFFMRCLTGTLAMVNEEKGLAAIRPPNGGRSWADIANPDGSG